VGLGKKTVEKGKLSVGQGKKPVVFGKKPVPKKWQFFCTNTAKKKQISWGRWANPLYP